MAKQAAEKGNISFWAFLKHVPMNNINDGERYNYLFVHSTVNIEVRLSDKNSWWNQADAVLSSEEQATLSALGSSHTWTADSGHIYRDEGILPKE